jgi:hypothetical protein
MFKLLVNSPQGAQEVISIEKSGGYNYPEAVLWDERKDGPLDESLVIVNRGALERQGKQLVVNAQKKAEIILKEKATQDEHDAKKAKSQALYKRLKKTSKVSGGFDELKAVLLDLFEYLGIEQES